MIIGVITYIGESNIEGHFISLYRDPLYRQCYKYNVEIVIQVIGYQNEVYNFPIYIYYFIKK